MKLSAAINEFRLALSGEKASRTVEWYVGKLRTLQEFLNDPEVENITTRDLRLWREHLQKRSVRYENHPLRRVEEGPLSPQTINGYIRTVRRFFTWLVEEGIITTNPASRLGLVRVPDENPKTISREDAQKLIKAAKEKSSRDFAIVCFLVDTGCRVGGLITLTLDRLDIESRTAVVVEKHRGGAKARTVYFSDITAEALEKWLQERPDVDLPYVFLNIYGAPLSPNAVHQILKRLAKAAGVKGPYNPHSFRHAFARTMLEQGLDLGAVSQLMGHSDITTTHKFYARWEASSLRELHQRHSPLSVVLSGKS